MAKLVKPKKKAPKKSSALVKRERPLALTIRDSHGLMPQQATGIGHVLASEPMMTASFIGTMKLNDKQIRALRRPVEDGEVEWRPLREGGPPAIPYLSHNGYRDRLDAAFGLGGWGMAPVGVPKEKDGVVYVPFGLVVGGVPRIYAWGEQSYHPNNKQMTYGDALEGAKSNAITRCGKELGIARDLWNRPYIEALKRRVLGGGRTQRHQQDEPHESSRQREETRPPAQSRSGDEQEPISLQQRERLFKIAKAAGRTKVEVTSWVKATYKVESTGQIQRKDYDAICTAIEKRGPLPKKEPARQPDEILPPITDDQISWGLK